MTQSTVIVPATTANIGPGFDCLGTALTLYNQVQFTLLPEASVSALELMVQGSEAEQVSTQKDNLLYRAWSKVFEVIGKPIPGVSISIQLGVPLARGLGSSATAIVGGLFGANQLAGNPLDQQAILGLAIELEGHPDNVVPALLGGCQLCAGSANNWQICDIPWHSTICPIVAIPNFELSTAEARSVLPQHINYGDALFNVAHMGLLLRALETGKKDWLEVAMSDRLHQPYRRSLIKGYDLVEAAALQVGAIGMVISGAGPSLLALAPEPNTKDVALAMEKAWASIDVQADAKILKLDMLGARCVEDFVAI